MDRFISFAARRLAVVATALVMGCASIAPTQAETTAPGQAQIHDEIVAVLEAVKADWNAGNYDALKSHWDISDEMPFYLAEESDVMMASWADIEAYWAGTDAWNEWIVVEYSNYQVKRIDETNAMVMFDLRFDVQLNDRPNPIGGDNRGVVSLRKVDGAWKIHAWIEAPLAAITYMRKLYELNVRDDLREGLSAD